MGHKTMVDGVSYEISGGKTLVNGTAYSIDKGKTLVDGTAYEVGFGSGGPYTVAVIQLMLGSVSYIDGLVQLTMDGQTYKPSSDLDSDDHLLATAVVPSETVLHCYANSSGKMMGQSRMKVNDNIIQDVPSALVEYDHIVKGNLMVVLNMQSTIPAMAFLEINIIEIPEGCIAFVVKPIANNSNIAYETHIAKDGMTWGEWINSEYNTDGYWISSYDNESVCSPNGEFVSKSTLLDVKYQNSNDLIVANEKYSYYINN